MSKPKLRLLLIDHIHIPENYPYKLNENDPDFLLLKEDIRTKGLLKPIHVQKRPDGEYECLIGEGARRLKAMMALKSPGKATSVPCYVHNRKTKLKGVHRNGKRER